MICNIIFIILNICTFDNIVKKKKHFGAAGREMEREEAKRYKRKVHDEEE